MSELLLFEPVMDIKVYVGCALTQASEEFRQEVEAFKATLKPYCIVLQFLGLKGGTCRDVWIHDIVHCIGHCDLFVALCDLPSIGLGVELGVQMVGRAKPTIAAAHEDSSVTRLILDPQVAGEYRFVRYRKLADLFPIVLKKIESLKLEKACRNENEGSMATLALPGFTTVGQSESFLLAA